jgi:hypothetical protein
VLLWWWLELFGCFWTQTSSCPYALSSSVAVARVSHVDNTQIMMMMMITNRIGKPQFLPQRVFCGRKRPSPRNAIRVAQIRVVVVAVADVFVPVVVEMVRRSIVSSSSSSSYHHWYGLDPPPYHRLLAHQQKIH